MRNPSSFSGISSWNSCTLPGLRPALHVARHIRQYTAQRVGAWLCLGLCLCLAPVAIAADAPEPPPVVKSELPDLALAGSGDFDVLFWDVYVAALWAKKGVYKPGEPHVLVLRYEREFKGEDIADRSLSEMEDIAAGTAEQRQEWHAIMLELFPTVRDGDQLTGVHYPGERSVFYWNDELIGEVSDPAFGPAFFGIWLDEKTNAPELRRELLGAAAAQPGAPASGSR